MEGNPRPTESSSDVKFEIGHVLFIDVVGYSKLLINEQSEQIQKLKEIVRGTEQVRLAEAEGKLLRLPTGDGGALVFRNSPEAPVLCALEIAKALRSYPELRVRMGIHSGPVNEVTDLNAQANIAGAGINVAQRVMDCGDAGHILVSKHVADDLEQYEHWRRLLHELGPCEVKHGVRIDIANLYSGEVGNRELPEKFQALKKHRSHVRWAEAAIALLVLAAVVAAFIFVLRRPSRAPLSIAEKSIAVLPFENLSEDKANAYFVAGVQDEILTALAKISALKVISKTSTAKYSSRPDNLKVIARELGVATILEGSVQRSGEAVHINVQLVSGQDDSHLWADSYDRELKDIFGVQREVAETVASKLKAKLLPQESSELARVPTSNLQAYDLYLKAKYFYDRHWTGQVNSVKPAIDLLQETIALDPGFALAYAHLALTELAMYVSEDRSPKLLADSQAHVEKSLALEPDLIEGHLARARIYLWAKRDHTHALEELQPLIDRAPNDPRIALDVGTAKGRSGDWQGQLAGTLRAVDLDPRNTTYLRLLADLYSGLRRYSEAGQMYAKAQALEPADFVARMNVVFTLILTDKLSDARTAINQWPDANLKDFILSGKYSILQQIETLSRDYDAALAAAVKIPAIPNHLPTQLIPAGDIKKNTDIGFDELFKGDAAKAAQAFAAARQDLESLRASHVDDPDFYAAEALIAAGMSKHDDAVQAARKAVALAGTDYLLTLAQVHAHFGDADLALETLNKLIADPIGGNAISAALLRRDPIWDPIRKDPRFENAIASLAAKESR